MLLLNCSNALGILTGWWYTYPSEKYERQWGLLFPTEWKNKIHVPNHQPDFLYLPRGDPK